MSCKASYPKDFKFTGWHPHCRCYVTTILKTPDEIKADNERILRGEEPTEESENEVAMLPQNFVNWQLNNVERAKHHNNVPYFIKDNPQYILPELAQAYGKLAIPIKWKDEFAIVRGEVSETVLKTITKIAQGINHAALEKSLGIKKGVPMTFNQADGHKVNPHYGEEKQYSYNCQTCTIAYELRRRGFNIEAMGNPNNEVWKILGATDTQSTMKTAFGEDAKFDMFRPSGSAVRSKNKKQKFEDYINQQTSKDGRYELRLRWNKKEGHVVCLERVNGFLIWYDPQSGQKGDRLFLPNEIAFLEKAVNIGVRRMDDKLINRKMFERLIKKH